MGAGAVGGHRVSPEEQDRQLFPPSFSSSSPSSSPPYSSAENGQRNIQGGLRGVPGVDGSRARTHMPRNSTSVNSMPDKVLCCETCDNTFGFFKRKKICKDCHRWFCSTCLPKPPSSLRQNGRQCDKCTILTSGKFTRQQLLAWRVKDMRCFLNVRNIPTSTCKEKHDLIDLLLLHFCLESSSVLRERREHDRLVGQLADRMRSGSFYSSPTLPHQVPEEETTPTAGEDGREEEEEEINDFTNPPHQSPSPRPSPGVSRPQENRREEDADVRGDPGEGTPGVGLTEELRQRQMREMRETVQRLQEELLQDEPETRPGIQRASIDDLENAEEAETLTVRQLKEILANNFVDYRGCCEKHELVERVKRLWNDTQANRERVSAATATTDAAPTTTQDPNTPSTSATTYNLPAGSHQDPEHDVCKICMDSPIDCILLECGHMVTCSKCGKRLADCPICRQYITRVVHVFRS